jgi:diadenosine tetraphosphate (Ap4A) HIT family hydrolase/5-methylcytosine-specific restriction endonuclease McrA
MTYDELLHFVRTKMRMSHVYQPVMLMKLLENNGRSRIRDIASSILARDESQIEYYEQITKNMVGRVLQNHNIVAREGSEFALKDYRELTPAQAEELIAACQSKIDEYLKKRGELVWEHRRRSAALISGTIKYEVLKRAAHRCELCGIGADLKGLEVDHILPRNRGGTDDLENLQALCYSCNAMKRDRDDTDFRSVAASYEKREAECPFCAMPAKRVIAENALAFAARDAHPVTDLHTLVIPKRHVTDYFGLTRPEWGSCDSLLRKLKDEITRRDPNVEGFNVGANVGEVAGQTIFHAHIHLIPRRRGDVERPRGGVRHVIPAKGNY